jgi:hypothetical protein
MLLPALLEKCEVPALLRYRKYADIGHDSNDGLDDVLSALAK